MNKFKCRLEISD